MKPIKLLAALILVSGVAQATSQPDPFAFMPTPQMAANETPSTAGAVRADRINRNIDARVNNQVERRDAAASSPGSGAAVNARTDRINRNTDARTGNRVERRETGANAVGTPGLDTGIERRNGRRDDRRVESRTGTETTNP